MIRTIHVDGFKSIKSQDIPLGRLNCFIGANGAGKSNVLEAIGILGAAAKGIVDDEALLRRGVRPGVPRLYKSSFADDVTPPHIHLSAAGNMGETYRVTLLNPLDRPRPAWQFKTEYLYDGNEEIVSDGVRKPRPDKMPKTNGLAALRLLGVDEANPAAELMQNLQQYALYTPNTLALRGMVTDPQPREPVGLSGGLLAEGFESLRRQVLEDNDGLFDDIVGLIDWVASIDVVQTASSLLSPSVPRAKSVLKFTDRFMRRSRNTLTAYDASEGALYVLFSAILCLSPASPRFFAIDNLDQALNPRLASRLLSRIGQWLKQSSRQAQMLFTCHNPGVLDGLDLSDDEVRLFTVDRNSNGHTVVRRVLLTDELRRMNRDYPLSRLWLMGSLGALPNV
ncbi:AAA family ATPase [Magnetospirillum sulfuroxidans]|uniref:AAA family ATPase n=1 Tax=Magnetospirillum sulfuroxidans TaxID=611300 RepID=A0ABS5IAY5_9PROT|nr:AAA family ATPase [Magnetospirillum sulfuroxidans]MBR9971322.1 AAA family ATPase [Magnetospirillum sulfuroxidans]